MTTDGSPIVTSPPAPAAAAASAGGGKGKPGPLGPAAIEAKLSELGTSAKG